MNESSGDHVINGLLALIIEGGIVDLRDDIMRLAVLFHSARMLGLDAARGTSPVPSLTILKGEVTGLRRPVLGLAEISVGQLCQ